MHAVEATGMLQSIRAWKKGNETGFYLKVIPKENKWIMAVLCGFFSVKMLNDRVSSKLKK